MYVILSWHFCSISLWSDSPLKATIPRNDGSAPISYIESLALATIVVVVESNC